MWQYLSDEHKRIGQVISPGVSRSLFRLIDFSRRWQVSQLCITRGGYHALNTASNYPAAYVYILWLYNIRLKAHAMDYIIEYI